MSSKKKLKRENRKLRDNLDTARYYNDSLLLSRDFWMEVAAEREDVHHVVVWLERVICVFVGIAAEREDVDHVVVWLERVICVFVGIAVALAGGVV